jgi:hypothetical protein
MDVVFGGDHGACHFHAVIQLIFHNVQCHVKPYAVSIHVGNMDCNKDTREILEKTIGKELNKGLRWIVGKFLVVHVVNNVCTVTFLDEPPGDETEIFFSFLTWTLIAGDLAFYATILGKENVSSVWCTWCKLSKAGWAHEGHQPRECWTLDAMQQLRQNLSLGNIPNDAETIKGCTEPPLFNAVPVENYIVPVLHLLIGVGNNLLESLLEWVSERVEKLTHREVVHRNAIIYLEARNQKFKKDYDTWIQNEGITLTDLQAQKVALALCTHSFIFCVYILLE